MDAKAVIILRCVLGAAWALLWIAIGINIALRFGPWGLVAPMLIYALGASIINPSRAEVASLRGRGG